MKNQAQPLVWVVTRNHNNYPMTSKFISEIKKIDYPNYHVHIVDDGSHDRSIEKLKRRHIDIGVTRTNKYVEYCRSLNLGIKKALENKADYVFLVNNDTRNFSKDYLNKMINAFTNGIGMVGSCCYNYDGKTLWKGEAKDKWGIPMEIPTSGYIIKREVFEKIGLLDENLVRYFEDLDFIIRLRNAGFQTKAINTVSYEHLCQGTSGKQVFVPNYYRIRNLIWFMRRYRYDQPRIWMVKVFLHNIYNHFIREMRWYKQGENQKFIASIWAIFLGAMNGLFMRWKPETGVD